MGYIPSYIQVGYEKGNIFLKLAAVIHRSRNTAVDPRIGIFKYAKVNHQCESNDFIDVLWTLAVC